MIRLNLLPNVRRETAGVQQAHRRLIRAARFSLAGALGATLLLALWVYGVQALQRTLLDKSIAERYQKLRAVKDIDTYATIQNRLAVLGELQKEKNLTSRLFDYLPTLGSGVQLSKVSISEGSDSLVFEGKATDYRRLVVFRDSLRNTSVSFKDANDKQQRRLLFTSVTLNKSNFHASGEGLPTVSFKVTGKYRPVALSALVSNPTLSVSNQETTPSVLAAPLVDDGTRGSDLEVRP